MMSNVLDHKQQKVYSNIGIWYQRSPNLNEMYIPFCSICCLTLAALPRGRYTIISLFSKPERVKYKNSVFTIFLLLLLQIYCCRLWARPSTMPEAEKVVTGWLITDAQPLGTIIGRQVIRVETFTDDTGEPIYYIAYLRPSGFVIVSADDLVEPIIGFSSTSTFDSSSQNPLGALVIRDMKSRLAEVKTKTGLQSGIRTFTVSKSQNKWGHYVSLAETSGGRITSFSLSSISDIRVAPLIQSTWHQLNVCNHNCYNYYTPNNYPAGCVATAMAQFMRYHQYPTTGIGIHDFKIKINGSQQTAYTLGGDGAGGAYNWNDMVLVPDCTTSDIQLQAIGALCYDAGISTNMEYGPEGSSADAFSAAEALTTTFKYANAVKGFNQGNDIGSGSTGMINPNLDYGNPVILGIWRTQNGHAVICDGYGYSGSTLYHHLNMGWSGNDDAWYNLPKVDAKTVYTSVIACIYNIFTSGTGEIISGLVTDTSGKPIFGVKVTARDSRLQYEAITNKKGIYALANVPSEETYIVSITKTGYLFTDRIVTTGASSDGENVSGNRWQIDFVGSIAGDLDGDNDVDINDFVIFTSSWLTKSEDAAWNPACDISTPADNFIDAMDFAVFVNNWQQGIK